MVGEEQFRSVMGHFATGITVVASRGADGKPVGLTVNAFTSVSLDPPLVLVCVHKQAEGHDAILAAGHFGVSILAEDQGDIAMVFSQEDPVSRFEGVQVRDGPLGSPILQGALAWIECRIEEVFPGGDHSIVLGRVVGCEAGDGEPVLFFRGALKGSPS
jgi:flavin reductase (DIM6/NTAB) family NADH-FMN oxidoreductase RutF